MALPKTKRENDEFWVLLSISVMVIVQDGRVYFLGQECLKDRRLKSHSSADVSRRSTYLFGQNAYERFRPDRFFHNSTQSLPTASRFTFPHPTHSLLNCFFKFFINAMSRNAHLYGRWRWITSQRLRRWLLLKSHSLVEAVQNTTDWQVFSSFISFLFKH